MLDVHAAGIAAAAEACQSVATAAAERWQVAFGNACYPKKP
jgi:hypothetical protein